MGDSFVMALVGCGKAKLDVAAPARDLYTGPLFRAARAHVEARYEHWGILSAKHRLVEPDRVLAPYDVCLDDLSEVEQWVWTENMAAMARLGHGPFPSAVRRHFGVTPNRANRTNTTRDEAYPIRLDVYAGRRYVEALPQQWHDRFDIRTPLAGLGQGERLGWFARHRQEAA